MKDNSKGMTLVEVLVALSIFTIVLSITYGIYISSTKSISKTEIKAMLQSEAQMIQYKLTPLAMESKGVNNIEIIKSESDFISISSISFEGIDGKSYIFELEERELSLLIDDSVYKLSSNVESFGYIILQPYESNEDINSIIKESESIELRILLHEKRGFSDVKYPISTIINFRNKN